MKRFSDYDRIIGLFVGFLTVLASAPSFADEAVCSPDPSGNPGSDVEKAAKDPKCAVVDDFARSCAYRDFHLGEKKATLGDAAKRAAERFSSVFDPSAKIDPKNAMFLLQSAATDPRFFDLFEYWDALGRPSGGPGRYPEGLRGNFTDSELKKFYSAIGVLPFVDPGGVFLGAMGLMTTLPDGLGRSMTVDDRKALFEGVFRKGLEFEAAHSAGCPFFAVDLKTIGQGEKKFGPVYRLGQRTEDFPDEKRKAIADSIASVGDRRTVSGMTDRLEACGGATAGTHYAVREIVNHCDVDLPVVVFADNHADLSQPKRDLLLSAIEKNDCYRKSVKEGLKIQKVSVSTSANTLHNTAIYCKQGFADLSSDRAKTIEEAMKGYFADPAIRYEADSSGGNGDGSSGPCAYVATEVPKADPSTFEVTEKDGNTTRVRHFKETRDPRYSTPSGEKALEPFKFAKTTIYFEDRSTPVTADSKQWSAITHCRELSFRCGGG